MKRIYILAFALSAISMANPLAVWAQSPAEGQKLYSTHCSACHGEGGKGDGPAGNSLPVKPADHTDGKLMNSFPDKFLLDIIAKGGVAVGKSPFMPSWGGVLKENQVRDLVAYLRSIANPSYKASGK